jgi:hypothetical protein
MPDCTAAHTRRMRYCFAAALTVLVALLTTPSAANAATQAWQMSLTGRGTASA